MRTVFDPFVRLEKLLSPHTAHLVLRLAVIGVLIVFLAHRITQYRDYFFKPLWVVESLIFVVFIIAYAVRSDPVDRSRGAQEIVVPLVGAVLPFGLLFSRPAPFVVGHHGWLYLVFGWMTLATCFTIWGLWALRRSFSITVEARPVVTGGPYRWIRHPVYLGEMLTAAAVTVWRLSAPEVGIFIVFVFVQVVRARWEERKLACAFPEYAVFARTSRWFW
jgi:protein-S-isoprenylcysteine O-methyltransferase Ste14